MYIGPSCTMNVNVSWPILVILVHCIPHSFYPYLNVSLHAFFIATTTSLHRTTSSTFFAYLYVSCYFPGFLLSSRRVCCFYAILRTLFFAVDFPGTVLDARALPVCREPCWSILGIVILPWNKFWPGRNSAIRPSGRAWHAGHVCLCTLIFPRRRVCVAVVSSPIRFDWFVSCQNIWSQFLYGRAHLG